MMISTGLRALALSASLGAAAVVATPATAAIYNNFNGTTGTFGNDVVTPAGEFTNTFTFVLGRDGNVSSDISSSRSSNTTNIDFTRVRLTGPNGFSQAYDIVREGVFEFRTFGPNFLRAGTYTLDVGGRTGGEASFSGNFNLSAVPEPATWGLMILGFGAVGGALRRRKAATVATA